MNKETAAYELTNHGYFYGLQWGSGLSGERTNESIFIIPGEKSKACDDCMLVKWGIFSDTWLTYEYDDYGITWSFDLDWVLQRENVAETCLRRY